MAMFYWSMCGMKMEDHSHLFVIVELKLSDLKV